MAIKKIAILLCFLLMILGGCGTPSRAPEGSAPASSQINVPENLTQLDGVIVVRSEIYREYEGGPALMNLTLEGAGGEKELFLDGAVLVCTIRMEDLKEGMTIRAFCTSMESGGWQAHVIETEDYIGQRVQSVEQISWDADIPSELVGAPGKIQIVVDGNERVIEPGATAYDEILDILQNRFPDELQEAQQAVLWADKDGFNWEMMCEQFDFLLLSYDVPQSVELNCLSTANPTVPQITFDQMLFPLTEIHGLLCVDTEETGPRCYGPLDKASAALLREYADLPDDRPDASSAPSMAPSASESSHPEEPVAPETSTGTKEPAVGHLTFRGETVIDIYTLRAHRYTTRRYLGQDAYPGFDESRMMELLEQMPEDTGLTVNADLGFIIFTETGRHYVYIDSYQTPQELFDIWETITHAPKKEYNIHWLTHMTTSKITEVSYSMMEAMGTVTDRESIAEISRFLKEQLLLDAEAGIEVFDGALNPSASGSAYVIHIKFDSGVGYMLQGYGDYGETDEGGSLVWIYTSDLDTTIEYRLAEGCAGKLRGEFLALIIVG